MERERRLSLNPLGLTTDVQESLCGRLWKYNRKVVISSGVVTTLAGTAGVSGSIDGTGTEAKFKQPIDLVSVDHNLYVSTTNHTIKISSNGVVTTLAGTPGSYGYLDGKGTEAKFRSPYGITTDGTNIYVAGYSNHIIRKVFISSGVVSTLTGSVSNKGSADGEGNFSFNVPLGLIMEGSNLFLTDRNNHTIRKINLI